MESSANSQPPAQPDPQPRGKSNLWLAALPALLITAFMSFWSLTRFSAVQPALGISKQPASRAGACAQVYGVNLYNSEYYVREFSPGAGYASPKAPRELATVVSGMVENTCDQPLNNVRIKIKVSDAKGARGSGDAVVKRIDPKQAQRFERAWIGQITNYEIVRVD